MAGLDLLQGKLEAFDCSPLRRIDLASSVFAFQKEEETLGAVAKLALCEEFYLDMRCSIFCASAELLPNVPNTLSRTGRSPSPEAGYVKLEGRSMQGSSHDSGHGRARCLTLRLTADFQ